MQPKDEQLSDSSQPTSEQKSKSAQMTKQSRLELKRLLHDINLMIVQTALASIPTQDYSTRQVKRRLYKQQAKHTKTLLMTMPISEQVLLLEELRSVESSTDSKIILPAGSKSSKE